MLFKQTSTLAKLIETTQKQVSSALSLGAGNQSENLQRTAGWAGTAVEHARTVVKYEKKAKKFHENFYALKKSVTTHYKNPVYDYATYGSQALLARAGNCQEYVGLAAYYLIKSQQDLKINFYEMPECFDHVLLKITRQNETLFYDQWMGVVAPTADFKSTAQQIIKGFEYELKETEDKTAQTELKNQINECKKLAQKPKLALELVGALVTKDFKEYCAIFEENYAKEMRVLYPGNPHLTLKK